MARRVKHAKFRETAANAPIVGTEEERFLEKVQEAWMMPRTADPCWVWTGATDSTGYGRLAMTGRPGDRNYSHIIRAHVLAYRIFRLGGEPIPAGLMVCHRCDVRLCANPDHLYLGDAYANASDRRARGSYREQCRRIGRLWR